MDNPGQKSLLIVKLLTPYLAVFPACRMDAVGLVLYSKALLPLDMPVIEAAMTKLLQTCRFFPSVAEIFEAAGEITDFVAAAHGNQKPTPAEAWQEVMDNVKERSLYKPWEYSCPEVKRAVEQFGRYELAMLETKDVNTARAQFMRIYDSIRKQSEGDVEIRRALRALGDKKAQLLLGHLGGLKAIEG